MNKYWGIGYDGHLRVAMQHWKCAVCVVDVEDIKPVEGSVIARIAQPEISLVTRDTGKAVLSL